MDCVQDSVNMAIIGLSRFINLHHVQQNVDQRPEKSKLEPSPEASKAKMCVHYTVEFWTPHANPSAEVERRVLRGIERPGRNRAAKEREFWLHNNEYLSRPRCPDANIQEGGYYFNRIFEFCFDDVDCRQRLEQFEAEYERCRQQIEYSESRLELPERQRFLAQQWSKAYNDWVSAYESHKDCPNTRSRHHHYSALHRAGVCIGGFGLPDKLRLGVNPNTVRMPSVGIERGGTPVGRR